MEDEIFNKSRQLFIEHLFDNKELEEALEENICCNETEKQIIKTFADFLKYTDNYKNISMNDIYLTLIYIYYSLNLNEQTTDWLDMSFFIKYSENKKDTQRLYLDITTNDININISSIIRRQMMGFL
jgi:hypothetical protein